MLDVCVRVVPVVLGGAMTVAYMESIWKGDDSFGLSTRARDNDVILSQIERLKRVGTQKWKHLGVTAHEGYSPEKTLPYTPDEARESLGIKGARIDMSVRIDLEYIKKHLLSSTPVLEPVHDYGDLCILWE